MRSAVGVVCCCFVLYHDQLFSSRLIIYIFFVFFLVFDDGQMKDVLLESTSPCHCTAHPLLGNGRNVRNGGCNAVGPLSGVGGVGLMHCQQQPHYVTSPYRCGSHSPPSSTTPTIDDQHDCSWITEPVYEELPSGWLNLFSRTLVSIIKLVRERSTLIFIPFFIFLLALFQAQKRTDDSRGISAHDTGTIRSASMIHYAAKEVGCL